MTKVSTHFSKIGGFLETHALETTYEIQQCADMHCKVSDKSRLNSKYIENEYQNFLWGQTIEHRNTVEVLY